MRRWLPFVALAMTGLVASSATRAQSPAEFAETAATVAALQNPDGGFAPAPGSPSSLSATNAALKILKHVGGSVPDVLNCIRYVRSCRAGAGFAATPGGEPDSLTTSIGLLAAGELKIADKEMVDSAVAYFHEHAKEDEQVRMAIAGLEGVGGTSDDLPGWLDRFRKMANADGSFPDGPGRAFVAGTVASTILRAGSELANREAAVEAIKSGQREDGAWSKDGGPSNLAASYRIMRALFLLQGRPDLERLRDFTAKCRKPNGLYSGSPGEEASLGATYQATIILHWTRKLDGQQPVVETAGFVPLFNGRDLTGWEGDESIWSARDGMIVGKSGKLDHNVFLATRETYRDFVLSLSFRVVGGKGNSGVQLRSVRVPGTEISGYQADIGDGFWGNLYDESRRNTNLAEASAEARKGIRPSDWNHYFIRCFGNQVTIQLNGVTSVTYRETDESIAREGLVALQVHAGDPMEVQFKDVMIQRVPSPKPGAGVEPGFHVRRLETERGPRDYVAYVPEGYDRSRSYPAILFLHGSGERGEDGVLPSRVGLGPAIVQRGGIPAIVLFPQARKTWRADSEDADAALKTLDDAARDFNIDPQRVILTGLSMGGMGTWSIAEAHPERFAGIVPVCGPGEPGSAAKFKEVPILAFVGDADSPRLHLGMRAMIEAIRGVGGNPGYAEYRGVNHNSWDRAYNDPATIEWMLSRKRP